MWIGVFSEATASVSEEYTESVSYDCKLYLHDIKGSKAHARMLARQGVLTGFESG